jgi:endonuclease YncB( thermonuclease family)
MTTDLHERLLSYDPAKISAFSLAGIETLCRCVRVVDGDTFECIIELPGFGPKKLNIRLANINAPEIHSKDPIEIEYGNKAKNALNDMIYNKIIKINILGDGMYGRYLAEIFIDEISVNQKLLDLRLVYPYTNPHVAKTPFSQLKSWYVTSSS